MDRIRLLSPALVLVALTLLGPRVRAASRADLAPSVAWLERTTRTLLTGCRVQADDGTWLYTPDGKGSKFRPMPPGPDWPGVISTGVGTKAPGEPAAALPPPPPPRPKLRL